MFRLVARGLLPALIVFAAVLAGCSGVGGWSSDVADPKITVAGDSIAVGLGASLREEVNDSTEVRVIAVGGTGMTYPQSFDWPARLEQLAEEFPPNVLVFSVGSNDDREMRDPDGSIVAERDDPQWWDIYRERLERSFDAFEDTDTEVWWVGQVCADGEGICETNRDVHRLATELADERAWVVSADLGELLGSGEEVPTGCLHDDGIHLTIECLDRAAVGLLEEDGHQFQ